MRFSFLISTATLFTASITAFPQEKAIVNLSANFIREAPGYEQELGNQALMGTIVEILDRQGYWTKIRTPEPYCGWVNEMGLALLSEEQVSDWLQTDRLVCTSLYSHVYSAPSAKSATVTDLVLGDIVRLGKAGQRQKFMEVVLPSGKTGYVPAADLADFSSWAQERLKASSRPESFGKDIVSTAMLFMGVPYMWGGTSSKNVDCSGLSRSVFFANGILLPRNCSQQVKTGEDICIFDENGDFDWSGLKPGDLIFWGRPASEDSPMKATHVGIYMGDGNFIHSSQLVRINNFRSYGNKPIAARRIIGQADKKGSGIISIFRSPYYFKQ